VALSILSSFGNNLIVPNTLVTFLQDDHYVSSLAGEPNSPWNDLAPCRLVILSVYFY
jgi:hypothetical protein